MSFRNEVNIKTFPSKGELREYTASWSILKEWLQEIIWTERNWWKRNFGASGKKKLERVKIWDDLGKFQMSRGEHMHRIVTRTPYNNLYFISIVKVTPWGGDLTWWDILHDDPWRRVQVWLHAMTRRRLYSHLLRRYHIAVKNFLKKIQLGILSPYTLPLMLEHKNHRVVYTMMVWIVPPTSTPPTTKDLLTF